MLPSVVISFSPIPRSSDPRTLVFARHIKFKSVTLFLLCARVFSPTADILEREKTLGTMLFRAFPKRVGPRILSPESVDYFGTSEHYSVVDKKNLN